MTCCLQRQSERLITAAPRARKLPYGTTAESSLMLAGAIRPLAGIVKSFSDLVISESYRGSEHALPDPKNCMVAARANVGCHKY